MLSLGDFDRGWLEYEWRKRLPVDAARHRVLPQPEWNGCEIRGRTLLVVCEQGLGDTLQFIRYVPLLARRGAKVIVECQPQLVELLGTVEGAAAVVARGEPPPRFDAHVRLASLPGMLGTRLGNVPAETPYLRADPRRVEEWKERVCQSSVVSGQLCSDRATSLFTLHSSPFPLCGQLYSDRATSLFTLHPFPPAPLHSLLFTLHPFPPAPLHSLLFTLHPFPPAPLHSLLFTLHPFPPAPPLAASQISCMRPPGTPRDQRETIAGQG